jgi:hypothetical protein
MLYKVQTHYGDGRITNELVSSTPPYSIKPSKDNVKICIVNTFRYEFNHYMSPHLYISREGKKYIIPSWIEVHPETTMDDIKWIRPVVKEPKTTEVVKTEGSLGYTYKTTYDSSKNTYKCTCPGFWRSKGNCKHVKTLREKNLAN